MTRLLGWIVVGLAALAVLLFVAHVITSLIALAGELLFLALVVWAVWYVFFRRK